MKTETRGKNETCFSVAMTDASIRQNKTVLNATK